MGDVVIGTHYFDLRRISNEQDGDRGKGDKRSNGSRDTANVDRAEEGRKDKS